MLTLPISFHIADYQIPEGTEARIYLHKPSGAEVYNSAAIEENAVIVQPTMQMYAEEGEAIGQLQIIKDTTVAASFAIVFCIHKNIISDSAIESKDEFDILDTLINQAREEIKNAQNATSAANTAAESATTAANAANTGAEAATSAAESATTAADAANAGAEAATSAATSANVAADRANEAAGNIEQANIKPLAYSVSGESITAGNSAEKPLIGLTVHGWAEQVITTGAQLIDFEHAPTRSCVLVDASTGTYRCNMDNTSYSFLDLPESVFGKILSGKGKTLRFQCDASKPNTLISIVIYGTREDGLDYQDAAGTPGSNYVEMVVSDQFTSVTRAVLRFNQTQGATTTDTTTIYSGLMLYFRESAVLPFELYTGNAPSPSVEYPQAIDIAGIDGNISINLMGYNLWDGTEQEDVTGYTTGMIPWDGGDRVHILFDGNTDNADGELVCSIDYYEQVGKKVGANAMSVKTGTTYTKVKFTATGINAGGIGKNVDIKTVKYIVVAIKPFNNTATKISFKNVVISSSADTVFVGYTPSILNVIATPNGLPAVPVSAGGNYTDENGQQWICDEIVRNERGTGKRIQRIGIIESYASETINTAYMSTTGQLTEGATVLYVLDDVIETDLSAEEIAALSALHTYYPTTTISNDAGCDMTAAYVTQYYQGVGDAMFYGVADNLTTEASGTSVLDAHQGKVLDNKIGALADLETTAKSSAVAAINEVKSETVSLIPTVLFDSPTRVGSGTFTESIYNFERIRIYYKIRYEYGSVDIYTSFISSDGVVDLIGFFDFNNYLGAHLHRINLTDTTFSTVYAYQYFPPSTEKTDVGGDDAIAIYRVEGYRS
jgi:hypothetical protein|uniref:Baseplate component n=1 Tax=Phage sp. ctez94 TaxID=2826750 RepID=A0A8S5QSA2_9VIRU|nr:MAG TPA: Baseplate component [Phage sp. ctez94]